MQSLAKQGSLQPLTTRGERAIAAKHQRTCQVAEQRKAGHDVAVNCASRRAVLAGGALAVLSVAASAPAARAERDFVTSPTGLLIQDITEGSGPTPRPGDTCVVHWAGYTKNYQAKRIDNTSVRDEPYEFELGAHQAIPAFEEAVSTMKVGGVRRIEVPGERPELSYPRDKAERFASPFKYRLGPQPKDFDGQRALDFILDNPTLDATNRTLLLDIKLLSVRRRSGQ